MQALVKAMPGWLTHGFEVAGVFCLPWALAYCFA
jgi:mannose/fructose/N-acetylgalactosamine-specific phosphotransferase system component IIC